MRSRNQHMCTIILLNLYLRHGKLLKEIFQTLKQWLIALVALLYNLANKFSHCKKITLLTLFKLNLLSLPLEKLNPNWLKPII